jgi:hypothetical protein
MYVALNCEASVQPFLFDANDFFPFLKDDAYELDYACSCILDECTQAVQNFGSTTTVASSHDS